MRTAGTRIAASSASEEAPARLIATVAAARAISISERNGLTTALAPCPEYAVRTRSKSSAPVRCKYCRSGSSRPRIGNARRTRSLISYGGSNLVVMLTCVGVLGSIARRGVEPKRASARIFGPKSAAALSYS